MGGVVSSRDKKKYLEAEKLAAAEKAAAERRAAEEEEAKRREDDASATLQKFQRLLADEWRKLSADIANDSAEELSHAKLHAEHKKVWSTFMQALGGVEALEHIELDRRHRRNIAEDGTEITEWTCDICQRVNPVDRPLCVTCARLRFPDDGAQHRRSASSVLVSRKQELRAQARQSMAIVAATAGAAKRLTAVRRRFRAVRAALTYLEQLGKTVHSVAWCRESEEMVGYLTAAEEAAAEAALALAGLQDRVHQERMHGKRVYFEARGAKQFADEKRNEMLFEDCDEARREAHSRLNVSQKEYIRAVVARRDGVKKVKETAAVAGLRCSTLRALREGMPAEKVINTLRDEQMDLEAQTHKLQVSADVYREEAPKLYGAVGALDFVVDYKACHERTPTEAEWDAVIEECDVGLAQDKFNKQLLRWKGAASKALSECNMKKQANILKTRAECHACVASAWEGAVQVARVGNRQQLAHEAGLSEIQQLRGSSATDASEQLARHEENAISDLDEANRVLGLSGGAEEVLQVARDAKGRLKATTEAVRYLNEMWDAYPKAVVGMDPSKEEEALYESCRAANADEKAAAAAHAAAQDATRSVLEMRSKRAGAAGKLAALQNLRGCLTEAEQIPGQLDNRLWRESMHELRFSTIQQKDISGGLLHVGTCSILGQEKLLEQMHEAHGRMLALYSLLGNSRLQKRAAKNQLVTRFLSATGAACATVADAKAHRIRYVHMLQQQRQLLLGDVDSADDAHALVDTADRQAEQETEEAMLAIENRLKEVKESQQAADRQTKEEAEVRAAQARLVEAAEALNFAHTARERREAELVVAAARRQVEKERTEAAEAALAAQREEEEADVARQDAEREAAEAAKAHDKADKQRELDADVPGKARHALAKQEALRTSGACDVLAKMSIEFWTEPASYTAYPEGSTLKEIHQPKAFVSFLNGDRKLQSSLHGQRIDLEKYRGNYGLARTKRLVFMSRVAALDQDLLENTELAACKVLIDDLRVAGESLIGDIDRHIALKSHLKQALDWQKEAADGDDIQAEDEADSLVANLSQQLFDLENKIARNTANAEIYTEMMQQMRNRLHLPAYELEQGDRDLLVALDMQAGVRVESEAVQKRKRETGKEKLLLVRNIDQAKRDLKKFEYQLQRFKKESETARMMQDVDRQTECENKCQELRANSNTVTASLEGWSVELHQLDVRLQAIEEESREVGQRVARVSEMKKEADALVAQGWAGTVRKAIQHAEEIASSSSHLGRLRFKEMHRDFDAAVRAWKHVPDLNTDPTLAVEVMRTCLCATHDQQMEKTMEKMLHRWLDKDLASKLKDDDCSQISQTELKHVTLLSFSSAMLCIIRGQFTDARDVLVAINSEALGSEFSDIVSYSDIGMYGVLCVLATFEGTGDVYKLLHNRRFAPFLRKAPHARELATELYAGNYGRVLEVMTALDVQLHLDVFVSAHRLELMRLIHANAQRVARAKKPFVAQSSLFTLIELHRADSVASEAQKSLQLLQHDRLAHKQAKRRMMTELQSPRTGDEKVSNRAHRMRAQLFLAKLHDESDEAFRHARNCVHASVGALGFVEELKCSAQIEQAENDTKQISKDDEPRQHPSEPQIEIAISRLFAALRSIGFIAGVHAARSAAQHRKIVTTARRSGINTLQNSIRIVERLMLKREAAAQELAEAEAGTAAALKEAEEACQAALTSKLEAEDVRAAEKNLAEEEALLQEAEGKLKEVETSSADRQNMAARQLQELEAVAAAADAEACKAKSVAAAAEEQEKKLNQWADEVENLDELQAARDKALLDAESAHAELRQHREAENARQAAKDTELADLRCEVERRQTTVAVACSELDRERAEADEAARNAQRERDEAEEAKERAECEAAEAKQAHENAEKERLALRGTNASSTMQECRRKLDDMQTRIEMYAFPERTDSASYADPLAKLRKSQAVIDKHRKTSDRAKGVLWFVGCDQARKAKEEAKVRLLKAATERAQAQFRTRATGRTLRLRSKEANQKESQRLTAQTELYAALKLAEETRAEHDELQAQIEKIELTPAGNMYEMRRLNKEQAELEAQATIINLRAERNAAHALHLQEIYNTIRAVATAAAEAKQAAQEAHAEAMAQNTDDAAGAAKLSVIQNLRMISGRVDEYGRQLNLLQAKQSRRVQKCSTEYEQALQHHYVASEECRVQASIQGQASMAAWLGNQLETMRTNVGQSRKATEIFGKARKVKDGIILRHMLARKTENELYYYTPARENGNEELRNCQRAWYAADRDCSLARSAYEGSRATTIKSELDEIKLQLKHIEYQCERTFRKVKDLTTKQLLKQLKVEQERLDELKAKESVLRNRQSDLEEELPGAEDEFLKLTEEFEQAKERLQDAEGERAAAHAKLDAANKTEQEAQHKAKAFLNRLESEGIAFRGEEENLDDATSKAGPKSSFTCLPRLRSLKLQDSASSNGAVDQITTLPSSGALPDLDEAVQGDYKNRFKELLMRKILDGENSTPWTEEDEREFRQKFTEGLGGGVRKSDVAAELRAKESSLIARLGGYS